MALPSFSSLGSYFFCQVSIQTDIGVANQINAIWPKDLKGRLSGWTTANWTQLASFPGTAWAGLGWLLPCRNLSQCREVGLMFQ